MRWGAGIVGGLAAGILWYFVASFIATTPQVWVLFVGWVAFGLWFLTSKALAWSRVWLSLCVGSFLLPVAVLVGAGRLTAQSLAGSVTEAEQVGVLLGGALGTGLAAGVTGFVGFFLGLVFGVLAYFTFRGAAGARTPPSPD